MSSLKISRPFVGLGLPYGFFHGFRHRGLNSIANRTFIASRRNRDESCLEPSANELGVGDSKHEGSKTTSDASHVTWERFYQLDKDVGILGTKIDNVQAAIKDLSRDTKDLSRKIDSDTKDLSKKVDTKFDRLMYLIVGGVVVKAGFDLYVNERNWNRTQQK